MISFFLKVGKVAWYRISIDTPRWREGQTDAYLWGRGAPCLTGIAQIPGIRQNGIGSIDSKMWY